MHYACRSRTFQPANLLYLTFIFYVTFNVYRFLEIHIINGIVVQDMTCAFFV